MRWSKHQMCSEFWPSLKPNITLLRVKLLTENVQLVAITAKMCARWGRETWTLYKKTSYSQRSKIIISEPVWNSCIFWHTMIHSFPRMLRICRYNNWQAGWVDTKLDSCKQVQFACRETVIDKSSCTPRKQWFWYLDIVVDAICACEEAYSMKRRGTSILIFGFSLR